jgi:acyl-coenzyme A synthetase/AMP-(fatty) acid ligase
MDSDLAGNDLVSTSYNPPFGRNSFVVSSSGSTGNPKAIEISFATHLNRMMHEIQRDKTIRTRESRIVTALLGSPTSVSGVNTLSRVFLGQSVHILDPVRLPMTALVSAIESLGVTHLRLPSQLARLMADFSNPQGTYLAAVEEVKIGGESIFFETLESLKKYFLEGVQVVHTIGATEALFLANNRFPLNEIDKQGQVPLGTLSSGVELVQVPQLGPSVYELVASELLAEGYIGEPQLTSENFYVDESGTRRWRSGDLVVKTSTGEIMHCGRIDDVVKINGTVASPVETTRAIIDWPEVSQAITLPHKSLGKTFLVSHVEPKDIEGFDIRMLREFLSTKLPPHLRPAQIVLHNKIPSKEGGKIDRAQLRNWNVVSDSSPK